MNFAIYIGGLLLVIGAVCYGAAQLGLALQWVAIIGAAMLGTGIMAAVRKTDPGEQADSRGH